jgi:hypothetical protein
MVMAHYWYRMDRMVTGENSDRRNIPHTHPKTIAYWIDRCFFVEALVGRVPEKAYLHTLFDRVFQALQNPSTLVTLFLLVSNVDHTRLDFGSDIVPIVHPVQP